MAGRFSWSITYKYFFKKIIIAVLACEIAVAEKKSYSFSESGTTFFWEQLSRCCISSIQNCISCSTQRRQLKNVRAWVYRAWVFSKNRFHFHTSLSTGLSRAFSRFWRFTNVSHQICESDVKRLEPFAPAGNACEPLFTGTFRFSGEGEGNFFKSNICSHCEFPIFTGGQSRVCLASLYV